MISSPATITWEIDGAKAADRGGPAITMEWVRAMASTLADLGGGELLIYVTAEEAEALKPQPVEYADVGPLLLQG